MSSLLVAVEGPVRYWTLNRPDVRNALSAELVDRLFAAAADAASDPSCRVIVLNGAAPLFCSGSDLAELALLTHDDVVAHQSRWPDLRDAFALIDAPIVASVQGAAIGGGLVLMLYTDVRVAEERTYFAMPEIERGWLPPGGIEELISEIGLARARRLLLLGARMRAREAATVGFIDEVAERNGLAHRTQTVVDYLVRLSPTATSGAKRYFRARRTPNADLDSLQITEFARALETPESVASFQRQAGQSPRPELP